MQRKRRQLDVERMDDRALWIRLDTNLLALQAQQWADYSQFTAWVTESRDIVYELRTRGVQLAFDQGSVKR